MQHYPPGSSCFSIIIRFDTLCPAKGEREFIYTIIIEQRMKRYIFIVCLLEVCATAFAQVRHDHSACYEDSISLTEAILSEVTVYGLTGTQRMKDSPIAFSVISPKRLHQSFGTNIVDAIAFQPGISQISTGAGISKPIIRGLGYNRVVVIEQGYVRKVSSGVMNMVWRWMPRESIR